MNIINYISTLIITFLSIFIGIALAKISPEELKPGKKYIVFFYRILLVSIILIILYHLFLTKNYIFLTIIIILTISLRLIKQYNDIITWILLGIIFYLSSKQLNYFLIISSLIFLLGLPFGTLLCYQNKNPIKTVIKYVWYIIIAIILFLI